MKSILCYVFILQSMLVSTAFAQRENDPERKFYKNRHHAIDVPVRGHYAKSCIIDGEVYSTNDHGDLQTICTASGGEIVSPNKGRQAARKSNKLSTVCCVDELNGKSFVMVRGKVKEDSCGAAGTKAKNKKVCYKAGARLFNALKIEGLEDYSPNIKKPASTLDNFVKEYQSNISCGEDREKKATGRTWDKIKGFFSGTTKKTGDLTRMNKKKNIDQGRNPNPKKIGHDILKYNEAMPICCKTGSTYTVKANECACVLSSVDSEGAAPKVVGTTENHCADLHKTYQGLSKLRVHDNHDFLTDQLKVFMGSKDCNAVERARLNKEDVCSKDNQEKSLFIFYDLSCNSKGKRRKRNKASTKTILCHVDLVSNGKAQTKEERLNIGNKNPPSVNYEDIETLGEECHVAEKI